MTDIQISSDWQQLASYIELYNVKSSRPTFGFTLFSKLMYLIEEVYSHVTCAYYSYYSYNNPHLTLFTANKEIKSLYEAEQFITKADSLEEFAILLATSPFPFSRDLILVSLFCSFPSYKLGIQKPVVREWLYELSLQDPDAIVVAAQDPDLLKLVKLIYGKKLMISSFLEQSSN